MVEAVAATEEEAKEESKVAQVEEQEVPETLIEKEPESSPV